MTKKVKEVQVAAGLEFIKDLFNAVKPSGYKSRVDQNSKEPLYHDHPHILLPRGMDYLQASETLIAQYEHEESITTVAQSYSNFFLNDFLLTVNRVLTKTIGKFIESPRDYTGDRTQSTYMQIPIGFDDQGNKIEESAFIGSMVIKVWDDAILTLTPSAIGIRCKNRYKKTAEAFLSNIGKEVATNKVMQGKAVTIEQLRSGLLMHPINLKVAKNIVLSRDTNVTITNLILPYVKLHNKKSQKMLFYGPYGTGKTETAIRLGKESIDAGRTFFYLHNSNQLETLLPYLENYGYSTVFAEDIDDVLGGERNSDMNDILNTIDGQSLKNTDVIFVFTTNNIDRIHQSFRRSGRIDFIVEFPYCTKEMSKTIMDLNLDHIAGFENIDTEKLANRLPENIAGSEVTQLCKRLILAAEELNIELTEDFIEANISQITQHNAFIHKDQEKPAGLEYYAGKVMHTVLQKAAPGIIAEYSSEDYKG
jgi:hypothetical protein